MVDKLKDYNVIVVGGGHAGIEAAHAAARMGYSVLLVNHAKDTLGEMSCNPAIGGLAKGHLVKEIDALGGIMGKSADFAGIQFKRLNSSKGPAVRSSRAQIDRQKYKKIIQRYTVNQDNLELYEGSVQKLIYRGKAVHGIVTGDGREITSGCVVLTPGTFLNGVIHIGLNSTEGGRYQEISSVSLSQAMKEMGFDILRFKTGTCPRLDGRTIDLESLEKQEGDDVPVPFSFLTENVIEDQESCYITHTNEKTHSIIRSGYDRSPLVTGKIEGTGVRYCPSIEDKLIKFSGMNSHRIFLEPEGLDTVSFYPNGVSTSLPQDIQKKFLHSIKGLEKVEILRFGYGIEYDVIDPLELYPTLETKKYRNLFLAGQINGTTGYEEAAAQGLIAGINAAAACAGLQPLVLKRHQAYIGVLIDDLVTKGTYEPYRMFTSRAEYRLLLREDNAHIRLTDIGYRYGSVSKELFGKVDKFRTALAEARNIVSGIKIKKDTQLGRDLRLNKTATLKSLLKKPHMKWENFSGTLEELAHIDNKVAEELEIEIKYEGYIKRQATDISRIKSMEAWKIPADLDFSSINGLSIEIREKLSKIRPATLGQASRISGITPAAIVNILCYIRSGNGCYEQ